MSKRAAEHQGSKETGLDLGMSSNPNDAPKRATAAQMANRKIKAARDGGRRGRIASPNPSTFAQSQPAQQSGNPFGSIDPNVAQNTFAASASNGMSFGGQSQSFPQPTPTPAPPPTQGNTQAPVFGSGQNNSAFKLFGDQTSSAPSSFEFSTSNNQPVNNPFSNMSQQPQQPATGFQGFKGNVFNAPPAGAQTASPATPGGGLFSVGGTGMFGTPQKPTVPAFGASAASSAAPPSSSFGQAIPATTFSQGGANVFGTPGTANQSGKPSEFMQTSPDGPSLTGAAKTGVFNVSAPAQPSFTAGFTPSKPAGTFAFGASSSSKPETPSAAPPFSFSSAFGSAKPAEAPKATTGENSAAATPAPTNSLFGRVTKVDETTQTTTAPSFPATPSSATPPLFSSGNAFPAPSSTGSFFNLNKPKVEETPQASIKQEESAATSLFKPATSSAFNPPTPSSQPAFSLWGQSSKPEESVPTSPDKNPISSPAPTPAPAITTPSASLFAPSSGGTSVFGQPSKPAETPNKEETSNVFKQSGTGTATAAAPLFSLGKTNDESPAKPTPSFSFGQPKQTPAETIKPASSPFKIPSPTPSTPTAAATTQPAATKVDFTKTSNTSSEAQAQTNGFPAERKSNYIDASTETKFEVEVEFSDFGPDESVYPEGCSEYERDEILRLWRLSALNASFQDEIASVDPIGFDLDPIVARYCMLRKMIGHPYPLVTVYEPVPPGSTRKWTPGQPFAEIDERARQRRAKLETAPTEPTSTSSTKRKVMNQDGNSDVEDDAQHNKKTKFSDTNGTVHSSADESDRSSENPEVSNTLAMFASSYVAQKSRSSPKASNASDSESEDDAGSEPEESTTPPVSPPAGTTGGRSLFDMVEHDENGQPKREAKPEKDEASESTKNGEQADPVASLFGNTKFASSFNTTGSVTPQFSFGGSNGVRGTRSPTPQDSAKTGASPQPSLFAGLSSSGPSVFGATSAPNSGSAQSSTNSIPQTTPSLFSNLKPPGEQQSGSSMLSPLSANTSTDPSRATTPAPSGGDEGAENHAQADFTSHDNDEEETVFESRARGFKLDDGTWKVEGVGVLRILKNRESNRSRILLRADPRGHIVLNSFLIPQVDYVQRGSSVQFLVAAKPKAEQWLLMVKQESQAVKLAETMQENKEA